MNLVCKFRGDPLRDIWDPPSRRWGVKPTNQPIKKILGTNKQPSRWLRLAGGWISCACTIPKLHSATCKMCSFANHTQQKHVGLMPTNSYWMINCLQLPAVMRAMGLVSTCMSFFCQIDAVFQLQHITNILTTTTLTFGFWPWKPFHSSHSYDEYLWQVPLKPLCQIKRYHGPKMS